jgi:hypothetical protein
MIALPGSALSFRFDGLDPYPHGPAFGVFDVEGGRFPYQIAQFAEAVGTRVEIGKEI